MCRTLLPDAYQWPKHVKGKHVYFELFTYEATMSLRSIMEQDPAKMDPYIACIDLWRSKESDKPRYYSLLKVDEAKVLNTMMYSDVMSMVSIRDELASLLRLMVTTDCFRSVTSNLVT